MRDRPVPVPACRAAAALGASVLAAQLPLVAGEAPHAVALPTAAGLRPQQPRCLSRCQTRSPPPLGPQLRQK